MNKSKKYSRVSAHHRVINGKQVWVIAHIRINPRYKETTLPEGADGNKCFGFNAICPFGKKETKMQNETSPEELSGEDVEVRVDGRKPTPRPRYVNVSIRFADVHYLASFNHGPHRVFHNLEELLRAIEVECEKLK